MKKIKTSIFAFLGILILCSCETTSVTHNFSDTWTTTETQHWRRCTDAGCKEITDLGNHEWGDWVIDTYATYGFDGTETKGERHRNCIICNKEDYGTHDETEPIPEHEHVWSTEWSSDENQHWHACTAVKQEQTYRGVSEYACTERGDVANHTWDEGTVVTPATSTTTGIKRYTCTVCSRTKDETLPKVKEEVTTDNVPFTVSFNELTGKQCTVKPKIKAYIDAMKEAEKSLSDPYKMQTLNNGVDVCQCFDKNTYNGHNKPDAVRVSWNKGSLDYTTATVRFSTNEDMSFAREIGTATNYADLINLLSNTKYYYQLTYIKNKTRYVSNISSFETADYTRFIDLGDVYNVRDLGGYKTSFGGRVRQGLIFRGSEVVPANFTDGNGLHAKNNTEEVLETNESVLKLGLEIDYRSASEANNISTSPFGTSVTYKRWPIRSYDNYVNNPAYIKETFEAFANAGDKHVYFHCIGGADRTGSVAFILNAILGVSYTDLIMDFEFTSATNLARCRTHEQLYAYFPRFYSAFTSYKTYDANKTVCENAVAFVKANGVTDATIQKLRQTMIEGYNA